MKLLVVLGQQVYRADHARARETRAGEGVVGEIVAVVAGDHINTVTNDVWLNAPIVCRAARAERRPHDVAWCCVASIERKNRAYREYILCAPKIGDGVVTARVSVSRMNSVGGVLRALEIELEVIRGLYRRRVAH